jgi:hypothetical protein
MEQNAVHVSLRELPSTEHTSLLKSVAMVSVMETPAFTEDCTMFPCPENSTEACGGVDKFEPDSSYLRDLAFGLILRTKRPSV